MTDDLTERVTRLEAERDILATLYRYGHTIDARMEKELVRLFTPDGVYDIQYEPGATSAPGNPRRIYTGTDELAAFMAGHARAYSHYHKHLLIEPVIEVGGSGATATSYFMRVDGVDGERVIHAFGRYLDRLVKGDDGRWRFASCVVRVESSLA